MIPYTNGAAKPKEKIIIATEEFATLHQFHQLSETYTLQCGAFVDREHIIKGHKAKLILRPKLYLNDIVAPVSLLEKVTLSIHLSDCQNVVTTTQASDLLLYDDKETVHEFAVNGKLRFSTKIGLQY